MYGNIDGYVTSYRYNHKATMNQNLVGYKILGQLV